MVITFCITYRDGEVILELQVSGHCRAIGRRDDHLTGLSRGACCGIQKFRLQLLRVVLGPNPRQVARRRMTRTALSVALKECLSGFGIAGYQIQSFVTETVDRILSANPKKSRDVGNLGGGKRKRGHAFVGPSLQNDGPDPVAVLIVQHEDRAHQVWTALPALCVSAVTEAARCDKFLLPSLHRVRSRNGAAQQMNLRIHLRGAETAQAECRPCYASASLQYWKHRFTSVTGSSLPWYSYSMNARIGYCFSFRSFSTGLMGVSPWPHGVLGPLFFFRSFRCRTRIRS